MIAGDSCARRSMASLATARRDESRRCRLRAQCHLVFPDSGLCLWGRPSACAGRPARLLDKSARSEERGWEPRADGASAPQKLSDIALKSAPRRMSFYRYADVSSDTWLPHLHRRAFLSGAIGARPLFIRRPRRSIQPWPCEQIVENPAISKLCNSHIN